MARARNIKPAFFTNDVLADIEPLGRLLFIGLWTIADRSGRLEDRPRKIKAEVLPYDDCDIDGLLDDLSTHGFIERYEIDGAKFIEVTNFTKHQNPHKNEAISTIQAPYKYGASTSHEKTSVADNKTADKTPTRRQDSPTNSADSRQHADNMPTIADKKNLNNINELEEHHTSTIQAPYLHASNRADSLLLIPDSPLLIPDSINTQTPSEFKQSAVADVCVGNDVGEPLPINQNQTIADHPTSPAGAIAAYCRSQGVNASPSPELRLLIDQGATMQHFVDAIPIAKERKKGFGYLIGIVRNMLNDEKNTAQNPPSRASPRHKKPEKFNGMDYIRQRNQAELAQNGQANHRAEIDITPGIEPMA